MTPTPDDEAAAVADARAATTVKMSGDQDLLTRHLISVMERGPLHAGMVLYELLEMIEGLALASTQPEGREDRAELLEFWSAFLTRAAQGEADGG